MRERAVWRTASDGSILEDVHACPIDGKRPYDKAPTVLYCLELEFQCDNVDCMDQ